MLCYVLLCYAMLCCVMFCYVVLCYVILHCVMSCYVMLYCVVLLAWNKFSVCTTEYVSRDYTYKQYIIHINKTEHVWASISHK